MLQLDLATILWQVVNFLILFGALYFLLFRPVMAAIRKREDERQRQTRKLAEDRAAAAALRSQLDSRLSAAEEEAEVIISRAKDQAEVERGALVEEARVEVERILTEAHADAYRLKRQSVDEFHDELLSAVLDVSGLVIGKVAPDDLHGSLVDQLCSTVWEMGQSDMRRVETLRQSLGDRSPTLVARTARTLSPEQQGLIVRTFSALADRSVAIDLRVEPSLGLGLQVRLGDLVMDNTIAGRLDELRESVVDALGKRISHE